MAEFIDRKVLREAFDNADADVVEEYEDGTCDWGFGRQNILEVINSVPAAEVALVHHGRYKKSNFFDEWYDSYFICMECGTRFMLYDENDELVLPKCCPVCTARMDGGVNA